jgi:Uma2 family endonuclease
MVASPRRATLADLDNTPDDGRRYEIIDGELIVAAAPGWIHQAVVSELHGLIWLWLRENPVGTIRTGPTAVVLEDGDVVEPDLLVVSTERLHLIDSGRFHGAPDLAIEVLSPTSRSHDLVRKLFRYARAGIPEYWVADPIDRSLMQLRLDSGQYLPIDPAPDGMVTSLAFPGLTIDPVAVFDAAWRTSPGT